MPSTGIKDSVRNLSPFFSFKSDKNLQILYLTPVVSEYSYLSQYCVPSPDNSGFCINCIIFLEKK